MFTGKIRIHGTHGKAVFQSEGNLKDDFPTSSQKMITSGGMSVFMRRKRC